MSAFGELAGTAVAFGAITCLGAAALISVRRQTKAFAPPQQDQSKLLRVVPASPQPRGRQHQAARQRKNRAADLLPAEALVTFAEERRAADIDEVLAGLDRDLIGLVPIKHKVEEIAALLLVDRTRLKFGLSAPRPSLHMCFTGPPGTGKTTMALRMADLLHRLGYLEKGHLVHAMRDDLVGEFVGQTAPRTKRVLERAMGGVLFIDEAYYLYRASDSKDYGQEAIEILLQVMENDRENLVVVLAGYKDRMDAFFTSNPGMSSRITHHLDFAPYDLADLASIGQLMLDRSSYHLSAAAAEAFRQNLQRQMAEPDFANARSVRNELDRARLRHAYRLAAQPYRGWSREDLMRLEPEDMLEGGGVEPAGTAVEPHSGRAPADSLVAELDPEPAPLADPDRVAARHRVPLIRIGQFPLAVQPHAPVGDEPAQLGAGQPGLALPQQVEQRGRQCRASSAW
jgi:probable Rubsico expression protein CbbX